ncbi:GNAT family N-acetyltransferase [uncultured Friedmanniella sp.]|uniref:GNAT family N-acetyltransferase n=1 Tax=uncultured Friedmanniella sp. TaxID=335381 RepID=UPI0035CA99E8
MPTSGPTVRPYDPTDEQGWLRCRLLSLVDTCYYDDVHLTRTVFDRPSVQLVAELDEQVVGLIDVEIDESAATINSIAVHPDHQRRGIASRLLAAALQQLRPDIVSIDAWTREDAGALAWYRSQRFEQRHQYLHVYQGWDEPTEGFGVPAPLSGPVTAFCHAPLSAEAELRARFARVYVCTQFLRPLAGD